MYFPFFILHDRGKRSAEARSSHCAVMPQLLLFYTLRHPLSSGIMLPAIA